jgi:poly[(R)-3-hydroxyalkanoate] polymerase subunit PhaC
MKAPRPLPLFLELVREVANDDPQLAQDALAGLRAYQNAARDLEEPAKPEILRLGPVSVQDHGGDGPPALLIPSLINPPRILDLDEASSLTGAVARMNRRALLLDWGDAKSRVLSVSDHVDKLLIPLLREIGESVALVGYCLGGTMALAAANLTNVDRVVTLAAPWHFSHYPEASLAALRDMWRTAEPAARSLGALPMEVLQAAFWSLDPKRTVKKFAAFGALDPSSPEARRFVELEDWSNEGEPLPYPAAKELIEDLFARDLPGIGGWTIGGQIVSDHLQVPSLSLTADEDRIAPAETAPSGPTIGIASGHVGMVVGSARAKLHEALQAFLDPACR